MDMLDRLAHETPLPLVALALLASLALAWEIGARANRRVAVDAPPDEQGDEGHVLTAVLGLLALLVAFTFGMALDRHETRRSLVVAEANALGTAYLRTDLLEDGGRLRALLRDYAKARLEFGRGAGEGQARALARADRLQAEVWREAVNVTRPLGNSPLTGLVLAPLNEAIDLAASRKAALAARVPVTVLAALWTYAAASAAIMGYVVGGRRRRHRVACAVLFGLLVLALTMILDLDRPRNGAIRVPQTAMADAVAAMAP
ncbi:MAG: hypothetical protein DI570_22915 [Phenylobacterium zucineum]|nr:MAG: hypothetical protein DI570_22915 [Phenylobacterium zucineum]